MIQIIERGDMFADDADILVCPTNCRGVMGAGLAKVFARVYKEQTVFYKKLIRAKGARKPGSLCAKPGMRNINEAARVWFVATKDHWQNPSQIEWVRDGFKSISDNITQVINGLDVENRPILIHIPALGCGLGELEWDDVRKIAYEELALWRDRPYIFIRIFAPL